MIVTPDGRSSQFPLSDKWDLLYPHDKGFIAILCKRDHCTVWQFELRTIPDDTEGQSLRLR